MQKPETRLQRKIQKAIREEYGSQAFGFKVHGSVFQKKALPDLVFCIQGIFVGIEVKMPGEKLDKLQDHRLGQIRKAGGLGISGSSVSDVMSAIRTGMIARDAARSVINRPGTTI